MNRFTKFTAAFMVNLLCILMVACGDSSDPRNNNAGDGTVADLCVQPPAPVDAEPTPGPDLPDFDTPVGPGQVAPRRAEFREQVYDREAIFVQLDCDGNGFLSSSEYNGPQQMFLELDTDADGELSLQETKYMMTFAEIPAGQFVMGTDEDIPALGPVRNEAGPAHEVKVDAFKMASTEVTTAQYALFLNSALDAGEITVRLGTVGEAQLRYHYPIPAYVVEGAPGTEFAGRIFTVLSQLSGLSHKRQNDGVLLNAEHPFNQSWIEYDPVLEEFSVYPQMEDWPAVFIQYPGAMGFAQHYGLSLPTEAEWEYVAAAGDGQFEFATADGTPGCHNANYGCFNANKADDFTGVDTPDEYVGFRLAVGSYPANPFGVYDLAGNIWEWTLDSYRADFYQYLVDNGITRNPWNSEGEQARVSRGGSYNYFETTTRPVVRVSTPVWIGNDHWGARMVMRPSTTVFNGKD